MKNTLWNLFECQVCRTGAPQHAVGADSTSGWLSTQAALRTNVTILLAILGATAIAPVSALAGTQAEYRELKQWCVGRDKWTKDGRKTNYPHPKYYEHFHHYCGAMRWMQEAYKASRPQDKGYALTNVQNNLDYVISHVRAEHFLMPEVYAFKGAASVLAGNRAKAESNLYRALQLDPGHVDANLALARLYRDSNRKEKAKELVQNGLTVSPDSKPLLRLAQELGVSEAEIKAIADAAGKKAAEETISVAPQVGTLTEPEAAKETGQGAEQVQVAPDAGPPVDQPKIGSPTNPWCRFCPDVTTTP